MKIERERKELKSKTIKIYFILTLLKLYITQNITIHDIKEKLKIMIKEEMIRNISLILIIINVIVILLEKYIIHNII